MGEPIEYQGELIEPGCVQHNQFNFAYLPKGTYRITMQSGLHHSLAIQLNFDQVKRLAVELPFLNDFISKIRIGKALFICSRHAFLSSKLQDEISKLLYISWKDKYLMNYFMTATAFTIFYDALANIGNWSPYTALKSPSIDNERISIAAKYLLTNIGKNISVDDLAREFAIGKRNLQRGFQEHFGTTVHEYIFGQRMELAKRMLSDRSQSVKGIAAVLGYKHVENFITAYRKTFGHPPRSSSKSVSNE
jgi:AraC-like DNA-binding protein